MQQQLLLRLHLCRQRNRMQYVVLQMQYLAAAAATAKQLLQDGGWPHSVSTCIPEAQRSLGQQQGPQLHHACRYNTAAVAAGGGSSFSMLLCGGGEDHATLSWLYLCVGWVWTCCRCTALRVVL